MANVQGFYPRASWPSIKSMTELLFISFGTITMQENIKEQIIKTLQTAFKPYVRDSVQLTPLAQSPQYPWSSKFGGIPYWPLGMDYPKTNDGEKLLLLAQLNFSELPHIQNYPQDGLLQFFVADDDLYGCDFEKP